MAYEWDERKNNANHRKHGVTFDVAEAFDWDNAHYEIDDDHQDEDRYVAYGFADDERGYVIVFTYRGDTVRIISARRFARADYRRFGSLLR